MKRIGRTARKILVAIIGFPLLVVGVILIPAPGPGLITCFVAFLILSLEFDWAEKRFKKAKHDIHRIYLRAKARADRIENLGSTKK